MFCQYCSIPGHDTKDCRKLARFLRDNNVLPPTQPSMAPTVNTASTQPTSPWMMFDTGASDHVTPNRGSLHTLSEYSGPDEIILGDGKTLPISHTGHTTIPTSSRPLLLNNVLCAPNICNTLVSVAKLCKSNNVSVEFFPFHFLIKDLRMGAHLMRGLNLNDVYYAPIHPLPKINSTTTDSLSAWHHKFGHPSTKVLNKLLKIVGFNIKSNSPCSFHCDSCSINKSHKLPFGQNSFNAHKPLELIYSDVWGPVQRSIDDFIYYVIFVDYYSKYVWLYPMKRKSDVATLFPQFKNLVEKFFQTPLISIFTDNGGEYIGLKNYFHQRGISHFTTPPHTPEQNGIAERRHRHIVEIGLALLHFANLPMSFWFHAFQTAVYLIHRLPTPILEFQSPYQRLYNSPPHYAKLKPFGCLCFPWLKPYNSSKLQPSSARCIFQLNCTFRPLCFRVFAGAVL
ncbi:putative RNA-directed DNA polymerase [Helianthus anomalus]